MQPPLTGAKTAYEGQSTPMAEAKSGEPLKQFFWFVMVSQLPQEA
jgi:hypothetical protein